MFGMLFATELYATNRIRVSIPQFTNRSATGDMHNASTCYSWSWFRSDLGQAFQERLIAEILKDSRYEVLERETLDHIRDNEINLKNASKTQEIPKDRFKRAQYTLVGTVSAFEYCDGGSSAGINVGSLLGFGDFDLSAVTHSAQVEVDLRAINTTTGKVVASSRGKGNESSTSLGVKGLVKGVSARGEHFKNSVLGKAIDRSILEAANELKEKVASSSKELKD